MLNDDNNYKKDEKKMRDFIRLEYEAKQKKEKLLKEAAIAKWIAEGGQVEKEQSIKPPKKKSVFSRKSSKCEMINRRYMKINKEKI
jgi:ABC-type ATPase with predicted acetyltransferase domain